MKIYPKEDIKNAFDQIIWYKHKVYECSKLEEQKNFSRESTKDFDLWVVTCEIIGNEYPILKMDEILSKFYTIEDQRDMRISEVLK